MPPKNPSISRVSFRGISLLSLLLLASGLEAAATDRPPNIIVFYTDDHGYADLGVQGIVKDIRTPHTDKLAQSGVRAIQGYSTAPQCSPSRAGLMAGRFQSKFGVEANKGSMRGFDASTTIPERLTQAGYATAMFGKWHLGGTGQIPMHGFKHSFPMVGKGAFDANIDLGAKDRPMSKLEVEDYHVIANSKAACATIDRYKDQPFFLYVAYRAPHTPLDAPQEYLDRFPGPMAEARRQALAMISAVDDGVGMVVETLQKHGLSDKTLIFYISDNGAPLKIHKRDRPQDQTGWDGSLNDPLNGEKGMLTEGGIRVPFVISWPGTIPAAQVYTHPVSTLDVAATALALAGVKVPDGELDGINLIPYLTGKIKTAPERQLFWRWTEQAAIVDSNWKFIKAGSREYLFDLKGDMEEEHNVIESQPEIAQRLKKDLEEWTRTLTPPGFQGDLKEAATRFYNHYLDGKEVPPSDKTADPKKRKRKK